MNCGDRSTIRPLISCRICDIGYSWVQPVGDEGVEEHCVADSDDDDDEVQSGSRIVKRMLDPKLPSEEEVDAHNITHIPYRNWCHHCIKGRGKEMNHQKRDPAEQNGISEYHLDYCFPGDEWGHKLAILVGVERHTKMKKAMVVPSKGATGSFAARRNIQLMNECGDKDSTVII